MLDIYDATVPVFTTLLGGIDVWLDKTGAFADERHCDVQVLLDARLAPDQYHFTRQVQSACDYAKFAVAKLAGKEAPGHPDVERTLPELRARVHSVVDYVATFARQDFAGAEERLCSHTWMEGKSLLGSDYLVIDGSAVQCGRVIPPAVVGAPVDHNDHLEHIFKLEQRG